jgi:hypothetical protein
MKKTALKGKENLLPQWVGARGQQLKLLHAEKYNPKSEVLVRIHSGKGLNTTTGVYLYSNTYLWIGDRTMTGTQLIRTIKMET